MMGSYQKNTDQTKPNQTKPNHNLSIVPPFHMEEEEGESDKAAERDKGEEIIKGGGQQQRLILLEFEDRRSHQFSVESLLCTSNLMSVSLPYCPSPHFRQAFEMCLVVLSSSILLHGSGRYYYQYFTFIPFHSIPFHTILHCTVLVVGLNIGVGWE